MILIAVFQMASAGRTTSEFESICLDISLQVILAPCLATSPVDNLAFRESRFRDEGLAYVKDVKFIDQFDRSQDVAEAVEAAIKARDTGGSISFKPGGTIRVTSEGHLYSSHLLNVTVNASDASLKSSQFPIRDRRLSIFGSDTRTICPVSGLPWRAIGEISMSDNTGQYICSGAMVGSDAVLTAAHCVYSRSNQAFFSTLSFAPGQSASQAPYGTIPWAHVTIYSNYASSSIPDPNIYDIAVIKLTQQVGTTTGWLGVEIPCQAPDQGSFSLVTAGYPDDKPFGTCVTAGCRVTYNSCINPYLYHECPTVDGQSGSAMWDPASGSPPKIKAVHNLQWQSSNGATIYNSAVAVTPLHYQSIISWIGSSAKQQIGHRDISTTNNPHPPSYP